MSTLMHTLIMPTLMLMLMLMLYAWGQHLAFYGWQVNLLENSFMTNQFLEKSYSLFTITDNE
jgi:hypothetical protein